MIKNIIFDMDGVLVDSEEAIRAASIEMFGRRGLTVKAEDFIPFTGMGETRFVGGVAEKYGMDFMPSMKDEAYAIYAEIADESVIVFGGVTELIKTLRERGYKLAVASAADEVKVRVNLRCLGLTYDDFDAVVTGSDVTKFKPDPQCFLMACEKLGGIPEQSLVVEDALAGCRAAKAAGMACIGVMSTFGADELKSSGADYTVERTPEMLEIIKFLA
jgi:HAD superfamily hydrolase (TIGR01509 family)